MAAGRDLEGILVVSIEQAVAAPYASCKLADAGARVIKVERPEGDFARGYDRHARGESAYFVWLNRGKESIRLDLAEAADKAVLARMIAKADVLIQNLAPGALARLGFDLGELRRRHPRLVTCAISGYGEEGPRRDLKAYDLLVQAESGLSDITGNEAGMVRVGVSLCDIAAGMTAYQAILEALIGRAATGEGREIAVSLYHALADWMNVPYLQAHYGGASPRRTGLAHPSLQPYAAYPCGDGQQILLSVQNDREWERLAREVLGDAALVRDPRFADNAARVANKPALDRVIAEAFGAADSATIAERLEAARIAYGRVTRIDDVAGHPQNRFVEVATPSGPIRLLAPGATHDSATHAADTVPALGEHDTALRREFGG